MNGMPPIEAERWRYVNQKMLEYGVDIQRLWSAIQQIPTGGFGNSGALTPSELGALTAAGSGGGGACPNRKILSIWGNPSAGTISISVSGNAVTLNYNSSVASTKSAIEAAAGYTVSVSGGTFPNNDQTVELPDGETMTVTSFSLTRNGSIVPHARVDSCCG